MSTEFWDKNELILNLWNQYKKTDEFGNKAIVPLAIPKNHPIVKDREERGLLKIIHELKNSLENKNTLYLNELKNRKPADWISEWKHFHDLLYKEVLKDRGKFRQIDVRFGSHTDEELYSIPKFQEINIRVGFFADNVCHRVKTPHNTLEDYLELMASIHHDFICLHPFHDGNGRIGRAIIDQLSLAFGFPMVMGGYPRTNKEQRIVYHKAIREAAVGDEYHLLKQWIKDKIKRNLNEL